MKWFVSISLPILILLNIFDAYSTCILMDMGVEEANPYIRWVMDYWGILPTMIITKGVFFIILFWVSYQVYTRTDLTVRENVFVISSYTLLNSFYLYFMYTRNLQHMILMC